MNRSKAQGTKQFAVEFNKLCDQMAATRPTAVNLFWAIRRMKDAFSAAVQAGQSVEEIKARLVREAQAIHDEDVAELPRDGAVRRGRRARPHARILTHCNAGALATAGYGTALGVIRAAAEQGKVTQVFADETRPFLQGARLTAWELRPRQHSDDRHHREHGRSADARRRHRHGRRRRRSHRRQRRLRQQDRHLHRRHDGQRARDPVLRRGAAVDDRSRHAGRRGDSDRTAQRAGGHAHGAHPPRAGRRQRVESGVRRDAASSGGRHHHREGHRARPVFGESLRRLFNAA